MIFSESFFSKVPGSEVGESSSACRVQKLGNVHLFKQHDGKSQPVREEVIADVTNPEEDSSGLPCGLYKSTLQSGDGLDLVVVCTV